MKYIIFDFDGTLHDTIKIYELALKNAYYYLKENNLIKESDFKNIDFKKYLGLTAKEMWDDFMPNLQKEHKDLCSNLVGQSMIKYIKDGKAELYSGVIEVLEILTEKGYKLIFLSNCKKAYMAESVRCFNLNKYFIDFYCSEEYDYIPKYEIFKFIKEKHRGKYIIVGDRLGDIQIAKKNNLFSIGCIYGYGSKNELLEANVTIENIKDILKVII